MPVSPVVHETLRQVLDWNDSRAKTWAATFYFLIGLGMICQTFSLALLEFLVNPPALVTLSAKVSRRSSRHSLLDVPLTHVQFYSHHGGWDAWVDGYWTQTPSKKVYCLLRGLPPARLSYRFHNPVAGHIDYVGSRSGTYWSVNADAAPVRELCLLQ